MRRTTARLARVLTAGLVAGVSAVVVGAGTASADPSSHVDITYTGKAVVDLTTWSKCGSAAPVQRSHRSVTVDVALVAGVGTTTERVEFVFGSPHPSGEGTFVVSTSDGSQEFWNIDYDRSNGFLSGHIDSSAVGASSVYNIVRSEQPFSQCGASDTTEATQSIGADTELAGYLNSRSAEFGVKGTSSDGRTQFSVVSGVLRPTTT